MEYFEHTWLNLHSIPLFSYTSGPTSTGYLSALCAHCCAHARKTKSKGAPSSPPVIAPRASSSCFPCFPSSTHSARVAPAPIIPPILHPSSPGVPKTTLAAFLCLLLSRERAELEAHLLPRLALADSLAAQLDSGVLAKPSCSAPVLQEVDSAGPLFASALRGASKLAQHPLVEALQGERVDAGAVRGCLQRMAHIIALASALAVDPGLIQGGGLEAAAAAAAPARSLHTVPQELLRACCCPSLAAAVVTLLDASRTGDAVSQPPQGGLHPSFALAVLFSLAGHGCSGEGLLGAGGQLYSLAAPPPLLAQLLLVLSGPSKAHLLRALLGHLRAAGRAGGGAAQRAPLLRLSVVKESPLQGLKEAVGRRVEDPGLWEPARALHPTFSLGLGTQASPEKVPILKPRGSVLDDSDEEEGGGGVGGGAALLVDKGSEGQGPRRDLFHACGDFLISSQGALQDVLGYALGVVQGGTELALTAHAPSASPPLPHHNFELLVATPGGERESVLSITSVSPRGGGLLGVDGEVPGWIFEHLRGGSPPLRLSLRTPRVPCLVWKQEDGCHAPHPGASAATLATLGWLCAAALCNAAILYPAVLPAHLLSHLLSPAATAATAPQAVGSGGSACSAAAALCILPASSQSAVAALLQLNAQGVRDLLAAEGLTVTESLALLGEDDAGGAAVGEAGAGDSASAAWLALPLHTARVREALAARMVHALVDVEGGVLKALRRGFSAGSAGGLLDTLQCLLFTGADLSDCLSPPPSAPTVPVPKLFRVVRPREFSTAMGTPLEASLFAVLAHWQAASPKLFTGFLCFVTASPFPPFPGSLPLRIELPYTPLSLGEHRELLALLPTAHTCTCTLELPNYYAALRKVHPEEGGQVPSEVAWGAKATKGRLSLGGRLDNDPWALACTAILEEKLTLAVAEGAGTYGVE